MESTIKEGTFSLVHFSDRPHGGVELEGRYESLGAALDEAKRLVKQRGGEVEVRAQGMRVCTVEWKRISEED